MRLRLVTFNIAHGRGLTPIQGFTSARKLRSNLHRIAKLIGRLEPDIVALQEIDERSRWAGNFDQLAYLRDLTGFPHAVFGINNRRGGLLNLSYGNALLSRYPIAVSENIVFGRSRVGEKGFLYAEFDVDGRCLPVVNLHFHYRSRHHRLVQLDRMLAYLRLKQRHHSQHWAVLPLVCGDFNTPGHTSDATASLLSHLCDFGDYHLHPTRGRTFPSPLPTRLLDFVFLPPGCEGPRSRVVPTVLSDHRPVLVDFSLP